MVYHRNRKKKVKKVQRDFRKIIKDKKLDGGIVEVTKLSSVDKNDKDKLYIIGNGFDLWHGLPTSYREFYEYAKAALDEIENYYEFDLHDHEPWHDFENSLGKFMWQEFFDFHNEVDVTSEDFRPKDIYGLEDELTEQTDIHVSTIKEKFYQWIGQINIGKAQNQMIFQQDSQFITFNYTSTLQMVYGVEDSRVFHIHGQADAHDDLIFGHGENVAETAEVDENGDSTGSMFSDAERNSRYPLVALKKPVNEVLHANSSYFNGLKTIAEIRIIGHSLNEIDHPYFRCIADVAKDSKWKVFCYTDKEKKDHVESLIKCGVKKERIEVFTYSDL